MQLNKTAALNMASANSKAKQQHKTEKLVPKSYKTILSGGIAGMIAKSCTAPLERIQMLNQTGATHDSIAGTFRKVFTGGGMRGLWRGNLVNCFRVFPHKSILFGLNDYLQRYTPIRSSFVSGAIAGAAATSTIYPMTVIRAHLSGTFDSRTNTILGVTKNIIRCDGVSGLYRGFFVTLCGTLPFEAIRVGVYAVIRPHLPTIETKYGSQPHPIGKLCAGATAGASAAFVTYPTDTLRRMLQVQSARGMQEYDGVLQCISVNYKNGGIRRFYYGLSAKLVRVIPDAAILFLAYESLKDFFQDIYAKDI